MEKDFLGKLGNISVALSENDGVFTLAFVDEDTSTSVTIVNANCNDLLYLVKRFRLELEKLVSLFNESGIDIKVVLP